MELGQRAPRLHCMQSDDPIGATVDHRDTFPGQQTSKDRRQADGRALAAGRLAAMRRRRLRIRRRVAGLTAALFSAAFLAVYVQLASGHDPALSSKASSSKTSAPAVSTSAPAVSTTSTPAAIRAFQGPERPRQPTRGSRRR